MMRLSDWSIRRRSILLGLIPAILMFVILLSVFVWQRLSDAKVDVATVGGILSSQLAASVEYPVISGNFKLLEPLVESAIHSESVVRVSILDSLGNILYERHTAEYEWLLPEDLAAYRKPVLQNLEEISEFSDFDDETDIEEGTSSTLTGESSVKEIAYVIVELSHVVGRDKAMSIAFKSMIFSIIVLGLCLLLARRMANTIAKPVEQLSNVLIDITNGRYDTETPITDGAELGRLQASANAMAKALKDADKAQENAMQDSINARLKAEEASNAKSEFLAIMSHELRTPINGAMGAMQLMAHCNADELKQYLEVADYSLNYLLELVEDILMLANADQNQLELCTEPVSFVDLLQHTLTAARYEAEKNRNKLHISFDDILLRNQIMIDAEKVRQVVRHIVGNAVKFTQNGHVNVAVFLESRSDTVCLKVVVTDNGVGISEEQKRAIFEPFKQGDSSFTREFEGAGIGLAVCASLCEVLGGEIRIENNRPQGTQVEIILPTSVVSGKPEKSKGEEAKAGRALIVEDNDVNRMVAEKMLGKVNFEAVSVISGEDCLLAVDDNDFDVIFMDCHMPGMDGFETTQKIRQLENQSGRKTVPIIALTANTSSEIRKRCMDSGMSDYLSKPLKVDTLQEVIGRWLS